MGTEADLLRVETRDGVAVLTMNDPRRLNGWTLAMRSAMEAAFDGAASDPAVRAVVLTGAGRYYSAGVDLSGSLELAHPRRLRSRIARSNYELFDRFIRFPKPILAALNGAALGAPVTTAVLCDAVVASETAELSTPFARLGVPPEGCSSVLFPRLFGEDAARRLLGPEGWKPTAAEAHAIGLVDEVASPEALLEVARARARSWADAGRPRTFKGGATRAELEAVNARESEEVADAFLSAPFLMNQYRFLRAKKKTGPALTCLALRLTRPAWSRLL
jgi:enoyl-CoA hydratase/carnithine racemase